MLFLAKKKNNGVGIHRVDKHVELFGERPYGQFFSFDLIFGFSWPSRPSQ